MKLKIVLQILMGFTVTYVVVSLTKGENAVLLILLTLVLGLFHELLHLVPMKVLKLRYRFLVNGLYIGFKTTFSNISQLIIVAAAPQIITLAVLLLYTITLDKSTLALAVLHIAISCEDLAKIVKYLVGYFM